MAGGDLAQEGEDVDHGAVVVGDGVVVAASERIHLRPTSVGELRMEQIIEAAGKRRAIRQARGEVGGGDDFGEKG